MSCSIVKHSVTLGGQTVDIEIEDVFWSSLEEIARSRATTTSSLVASINAGHDSGDLRSAIRVYVVEHYMAQAQRLVYPQEAPNRAVQTQAGELLPRVPRPRWLN
jgi:predicted DNA-binding ribbon-helix-helix protein